MLHKVILWADPDFLGGAKKYLGDYNHWWTSKLVREWDDLYRNNIGGGGREGAGAPLDPHSPIFAP